jgi:hypothetical protein
MIHSASEFCVRAAISVLLGSTCGSLWCQNLCFYCCVSSLRDVLFMRLLDLTTPDLHPAITLATTLTRFISGNGISKT